MPDQMLRSGERARAHFTLVKCQRSSVSVCESWFTVWTELGCERGNRGDDIARLMITHDPDLSRLTTRNKDAQEREC